MSIIVKGGGGSTAKELVNATGTKLADLEKKGAGKVSVVGGLGNTPPEKVLQGSIYSDESGVRRTGTMEDVTPEVTAQETLIDEIMTALVGKVQGANARADKILAGYKAYVGRQLVEGTYEPIDPVSAISQVFGMSKCTYGTITLSANQTSAYTLTHNLGEQPKLFILYTDADLKNKRYAIRTVIGVNRYRYNASDNRYVFTNAISNTSTDSSYEVYANSALAPDTDTTHATNSIVINFGTTSYLLAGATYHWIALGEQQ